MSAGSDVSRSSFPLPSPPQVVQHDHHTSRSITPVRVRDFEMDSIDSCGGIGVYRVLLCRSAPVPEIPEILCRVVSGTVRESHCEGCYPKVFVLRIQGERFLPG